MYRGRNKTALESQRQIANALLALLEHESYASISVSAVCHQADISRQTFYSLFQSMDNVVTYALQQDCCYEAAPQKTACSGTFMDMQDSIARYKADVLLGGKITDGREVVNGRPVQTSQGTSWVYYKVKSGDTLSHIAKKYHCTVKQLKSWNNLRSDRISIGQRLKVGKR